MPTGEPEAKRDEAKPRERRRLKLIESYGAFSDDRLQAVAQKIRGITSDNDLQLSAAEGDTSLSSGEITDSITDLPIGDPLGEKDRHKDGQSTESHEVKSKNLQIFTPPSSPNDSPIGSSNDSSIHSPNDSPNDSPIGSSNDSPPQLQLLHPTSADAGVLLTENQAILYFCLKEINGGVTSLMQIAKETHISEYTLKSCLKKLRQEGLICYGGRRSCGGRIGFTATTLPQKITLRGNKNKLLRKLQQTTYQALVFTEALEGPEESTIHQIETNHPMDHPMDHLMNDLMDHPMDHPISCSSIKKLLLQEISLEAIFEDSSPRSLLPYLDQFETAEELQNFLDMANACVSAAKEGKGKPIQNPHGFLFAQLRAGYINPPEGYKSRKVRAQEVRNQQLEEELASLRRLKERERELQFELFLARLSEEDLARLDQEAQAQAQVKPHIGLSPEFQIERYKDGLLKQWFAQCRQPHQERAQMADDSLDNI